MRRRQYDVPGGGNSTGTEKFALALRARVHMCVPYAIRFEWDERKRAINLEDYGVDFKDAALISEGIVLEAEDQRGDHGERRYRALGRIEDD